MRFQWNKLKETFQIAVERIWESEKDYMKNPSLHQ